jgi:hypothetical protein
MRKLILIVVLEGYAVALAWLQSLGGVRTDEAKYLLNIPYPHPPAARWVLSLTDGWDLQEWFWRVVFATLVVQAVWIVASMGKGLTPRARVALCLCWLFAAAVVVQAGSVMMAPLTALQGLLFVWLWMRPDLSLRKEAGWILLLWLLSVFTAYQAALFAPLVLALLLRMGCRPLASVIVAGIPLALLALYTLTNPLALASLVNAGTDNAGQPFASILTLFLQTWAIAGSVVLLVVGVAGLVRARAWVLLATFALLSVYNLASVHLYYAVLFTPFLIAGAALWLQQSPRHAGALVVGMLLGTAALWGPFHPELTPGPERATLQALSLEPGKGNLLMQGSFGHSWQYESPVPLNILTLNGLSEAQAVVCLTVCPVHVNLSSRWSRLPNGNPEAYTKLKDGE